MHNLGTPCFSIILVGEFFTELTSRSGDTENGLTVIGHGDQVPDTDGDEKDGELTLALTRD
jgi:hypothetical protein